MTIEAEQSESITRHVTCWWRHWVRSLCNPAPHLSCLCTQSHRYSLLLSQLNTPHIHNPVYTRDNTSSSGSSRVLTHVTCTVMCFVIWSLHWIVLSFTFKMVNGVGSLPPAALWFCRSASCLNRMKINKKVCVMERPVSQLMACRKSDRQTAH